MAYIDRDKVLNRLRRLGEIISEPPMDDKDKCNLELIHRLEKEFSEYLTADVVEVVRCENCKYGEVSCLAKTIDGKETIACYCNLKNRVTDVDYYCPSGERRDT